MADDDPFDMSALTRRAELLKDQAGELQEDLGKIEGTGYGGGGLVRATVRGDGRVADLRIDSSVIEPGDPETLAGLVVDALHEAMDVVAKERNTRVTGLTDNLQSLMAGLRPPSLGGGANREGRSQPRVSSRPSILPRFDEPRRLVDPAGPMAPPRKER
jgi:nucleoid-associated protein EbfC